MREADSESRIVGATEGDATIVRPIIFDSAESQKQGQLGTRKSAEEDWRTMELC